MPILLKVLKWCLYLLILMILGLVTRNTVSSLHERAYGISQASDPEKEVTLFSEQAFYYSFYKRLIDTDETFLEKITTLTADNSLEYPDEINAFFRFHIFPEVIISYLYRTLEPNLSNSSRYKNICRTVTRHISEPPVTLCFGLAHPFEFYIESAWAITGLYVVAMTLYGAHLSGGMLGGVFTALMFLRNIESASRIKNGPALRETYAVPMMMLQMLFVSLQLRKTPYIFYQIAIFIFTFFTLVFWQFSQFIMLTQIIALFIMEELCILCTKKFFLIVYNHFCALHLAIFLTLGNEMLITSLYSCFIILIFIHILTLSKNRSLARSGKDFVFKCFGIGLKVLVLLLIAFGFKMILSKYFNTYDDTHIYEMFLAKLTNYTSFNTAIYFCMEAYKCLKPGILKEPFDSGLIPVTFFSICYMIYRIKHGSKKLIAKSSARSPCCMRKSDTLTTDGNVTSDTSAITTNKSYNYTTNESVKVRSKTNVEECGELKSDTNKSTTIQSDKTAINKTLKLNAMTNFEESEGDGDKIKIDTVQCDKDKSDTIESDTNKSIPMESNNNGSEKVLRGVRIDASWLYLFLQTIAFLIAAVLVMRLKILLLPHMCLLCAYAPIAIIYFFRKNNTIMRRSAVIFVIGLLTYREMNDLDTLKRLSNIAFGVISPPDIKQSESTNTAFDDPRLIIVDSSIMQRTSVERENEDMSCEKSIENDVANLKQDYLYKEPLIDLTEWIQSNTQSTAVFGGPMSIMASVALMTGRTIVNHPHYETEEMRNRTMNLYRIYTNISEHAMFKILKNMRVTHLVTIPEGCEDIQKCQLYEEDFVYEDLLCKRLLQKEGLNHFYPIYNNAIFTVYFIHELSADINGKFIKVINA